MVEFEITEFKLIDERKKLIESCGRKMDFSAYEVSEILDKIEEQEKECFRKLKEDIKFYLNGNSKAIILECLKQRTGFEEEEKEE